jgi:hypothetical protein
MMKKLLIALIVVFMGGIAMAQTDNGRKGMTEWTSSLGYEFGRNYGDLVHTNFGLDCRHYLTKSFALGAGISIGQYSFIKNIYSTIGVCSTSDEIPELVAAISMRKTFESNSAFVPYMGMRAGVHLISDLGDVRPNPMAHAGIGVEYNMSRRNGLLLELGYTIVVDVHSMGLSFGLRF